jgi:hypothetical protein
MLGRHIERVITKHIADSVNRHLDDAIDRAIQANPRFQFVKAMQLQMLGCDPAMEPREAWRVAAGVLNSFLEEEGIPFGHPDYDWTRDGAVTLIHEQEIHHWEPAS